MSWMMMMGCSKIGQHYHHAFHTTSSRTFLTPLRRSYTTMQATISMPTRTSTFIRMAVHPFMRVNTAVHGLSSSSHHRVLHPHCRSCTMWIGLETLRKKTHYITNGLARNLTQADPQKEKQYHGLCSGYCNDAPMEAFIYTQMPRQSYMPLLETGLFLKLTSYYAARVPYTISYGPSLATTYKDITSRPIRESLAMR